VKDGRREVDVPKQPVVSYENLMGMVARSVFYRPERRRVRDLVSRKAQPQLMIDGVRFPLFDVSMNGASFLDPQAGERWPIGKVVEVTLLLHDDEVFSGAARVARTEVGPRGTLVGLALIGGFLDLPEIQRRDDEKKLEEQLADGARRERDVVPESYRHRVAEIVHFFQYYRHNLDYHERRYLREGASDADILQLVRRAADALREPYVQLQLDASAEARQLLSDRDVLVAAKGYTKHIAVPETLDVPLNHRAYTKPLGYPGDYQVMLYYYENTFEGDTVFTKIMHKFAVEHPLSNGVRTRKDWIVDLTESEHRRAIEGGGDRSVFRVANLGCGPAREVSDYIARAGSWPGEVVWTLIDQEEQALSVAFRASQTEIARTGATAQLHLLNLSFMQLLTEGLPLQWAEPQDMIVSAGLFDYLREARAQALIRGLYDLLAPGGLLAVGNAIAPQPMFWSAEFLVDWTLLYRTREEMFNLARLIPDEAEIDVIVEPGNAYYFLLVRRPWK
jgi:SAM-dependent methyltransferase